MYKEDGSGRDGYIALNNGGLTVGNNGSGAFGTGINDNYERGLRSYGKDTVAMCNKMPTSMRVVDQFINS